MSALARRHYFARERPAGHSQGVEADDRRYPGVSQCEVHRWPLAQGYAQDRVAGKPSDPRVPRHNFI